MSRHERDGLRWITDADDEVSVDDLFATGKIHLERMDSKTYWIGIYLDDGSVVHIDITSPRRIHAFMRGVDEPKAKP